MHHGCATSNEDITFYDEDDDDLEYDVNFHFTFNYDSSNGVTPQTIIINTVVKNDSTDVTKEEKNYIQKYLYDNYVCDSYWN